MLAVLKKELKTYFLTPIGYVFIAIDFLFAISYNMTIKLKRSYWRYMVCIKKLIFLQIMFR